MRMWQIASVGFVAGMVAGCATAPQSRVDRDLAPTVTKAQATQTMLQFSGKPIWDNSIQFVVKDFKVEDLGLLRRTFDAAGIRTTEREVSSINNFIALVAQDAPSYKGRTIDLAAVLAELRRK
jgi:hypothetical protein